MLFKNTTLDGYRKKSLKYPHPNRQNICWHSEKMDFYSGNYFLWEKNRRKANYDKYITVIHLKMKSSGIVIFPMKYQISNWLLSRSSNILSFMSAFIIAFPLHPRHFRFSIIVPSLMVLNVEKSTFNIKPGMEV